RRPDVLEVIFLIPLLQDNGYRAGWSGEAQRLLERALARFSFVGRFPLAVNRGKAPRIQQLLRLHIANFKEILTQIRRIDRLLRVAGPWQRLDHDAVNAEHLLRRIAGVVVVESHRGRRGGERRRDNNEKNNEGKG